MATNLTRCEEIKSEWSNSNAGHFNSTIWAEEVIPVFEVLLTSLISIVNIVVLVALLKSWKKLQQNIYIFAVNIIFCDSLLGLISFANDIHHFVLKDRNHSDIRTEYPPKEIEIFYDLKVSAAFAEEISSAGLTVCIILAYKKYVAAQMYKQPHKRSSQGKDNTSVLLSRKNSIYLCIAVWVITIVVFAVGLTWNCLNDCECFIEQRTLVKSVGSYHCLGRYHCSFLFPPMKGVYASICGGIFLLALLMITIMCGVTIYQSGGLSLSDNCYCYATKQNASTGIADGEADKPKQRQRTSVPTAYLRNMTSFIFFVTITNIICKLPANVLLVMDSASVFQPNKAHFALSNTNLATASDILSLLALSHSLVNPIVYVFTLHRLKQAVKDLLNSICCKKVVIQKGSVVNRDPSNMSIDL